MLDMTRIWRNLTSDRKRTQSFTRADLSYVIHVTMYRYCSLSSPSSTNHYCFAVSNPVTKCLQSIQAYSGITHSSVITEVKLVFTSPHYRIYSFWPIILLSAGVKSDAKSSSPWLWTSPVLASVARVGYAQTHIRVSFKQNTFSPLPLYTGIFNSSQHYLPNNNSFKIPEIGQIKLDGSCSSINLQCKVWRWWLCTYFLSTTRL